MHLCSNFRMCVWVTQTLDKSSTTVWWVTNKNTHNKEKWERKRQRCLYRPEIETWFTVGNSQRSLSSLILSTKEEKPKKKIIESYFWLFPWPPIPRPSQKAPVRALAWGAARDWAAGCRVTQGQSSPLTGTVSTQHQLIGKAVKLCKSSQHPFALPKINQVSQNHIFTKHIKSSWVRTSTSHAAGQ